MMPPLVYIRIFWMYVWVWVSVHEMKSAQIYTNKKYDVNKKAQHRWNGEKNQME